MPTHEEQLREALCGDKMIDEGVTYLCALAPQHFNRHRDKYGLASWPNEHEGPQTTPDAALSGKREGAATEEGAEARYRRLLEGVLMEHRGLGVWHPLACPKCERLAARSNPLCLIHDIEAALAPAAPEARPHAG